MLKPQMIAAALGATPEERAEIAARAAQARKRKTLLHSLAELGAALDPSPLVPDEEPPR
jgi:hypothetical protein